MGDVAGDVEVVGRRRIESILFYPKHGRAPLITFGIVLVVLALIFNSAILWIIGGILIVLGVIFWILGALGRAVGGRRHYY